MTARKRARVVVPCPPPEVPQHWWNAGWRWLGLTGEDGYLSHTKSVTAAILVWAVVGDHWSDGLAGILIAAAGGSVILKRWIDKAS